MYFSVRVGKEKLLERSPPKLRGLAQTASDGVCPSWRNPALVRAGVGVSVASGVADPLLPPLQPPARGVRSGDRVLAARGDCAARISSMLEVECERGTWSAGGSKRVSGSGLEWPV